MRNPSDFDIIRKVRTAILAREELDKWTAESEDDDGSLLLYMKILAAKVNSENDVIALIRGCTREEVLLNHN